MTGAPRCGEQARWRAPPSVRVMKATINIECTPAEARAFFGLPDVQPIQTAVMKQLQERMLSEIDRFAPEALANQWLAAFPQNVERMQAMFANMVLGGTGPDRPG